jgi:putative N6-adenine-specific DNA methylase
MGAPHPIDAIPSDPRVNLNQLVFVRLVGNRCTISVDSSGELLHRRGYRLATAKAPLRETLAAAMVMASGWDIDAPLIDPFCGAGTIPIEAALMARGHPPGRNRHFAFMDWPTFEAGAWEVLTGEATGPSRYPTIMASDRDAGAIRVAQSNAERAGVSDCIEFSCGTVSALSPPAGHGWVVTNPPFGVRVGTKKELRNLYAQFGKVLQARCPEWTLAILCDSRALLRHTGLRFDEEIGVIHGGLKVRMALGKVMDERF